MKRLLLLIALLPGIACAAQQNLNYTTTTKWGPEGKKAHENFTDLYTNKEPSVYVGETAPADTTRLFLDSNEEAGVLVQKKYVTGTGWVRVGSHGVQYASSCASITAGMCVDTDDGKLYYHNNTSVVEVGSGGSVDLSAYISKTNTTAFTPTEDYHPATKKYVDDSITAGGSGYTDEQAQDTVCLMLSGNTETGITVTCDDVTGKINFVSPTTLASFTDDATHRLVTDTEKSTWDAKQNAVETSPLTPAVLIATFPELAYVAGATSSLQSQIDAIIAGGCVANPSYTLTLDIIDGNGTDKVTINSIDRTSDGTWTGLSSATEPVTVTADTGRTAACSGTGITGSYPNYVADMTAHRSIACTFSAKKITGNFGNASETNIGNIFDTDTGLYLREVTTTGAGSNPTLHVRAYYLLNASTYTAVPVIYNASGALVWSGSVFQDTSAADPWVSTYSFPVTLFMPAGTYRVGLHVQSPLSLITYSSGTAAVELYSQTAVPWNGGVPPSTLPAATSTSTLNAIVWLEF